MFLIPAPISATLVSPAHEQAKRALRQMAEKTFSAALQTGKAAARSRDAASRNGEFSQNTALWEKKVLRLSIINYRKTIREVNSEDMKTTPGEQDNALPAVVKILCCIHHSQLASALVSMLRNQIEYIVKFAFIFAPIGFAIRVLFS